MDEQDIANAQKEIERLINTCKSLKSPIYLYEDFRIEWQGHLLACLRENNIPIAGYVFLDYDTPFQTRREVKCYLLDELSPENSYVIVACGEKRQGEFVNALSVRGHRSYYVLSPEQKEVLKERYEMLYSADMDAYHRVFEAFNWYAPVNDLQKLIEFAKGKRKLYIYGVSDRTEALLHFFDLAGITIDGFLVTYRKERILNYRDLPIFVAGDINLSDEDGIYLGLHESHYGDVINALIERKFYNFLAVSEEVKRGIHEKLRPLPLNEMNIDIHLTHHCNLNCKGCIHYSQLCPPWYIELEDLKKQVEQLQRVIGDAETITNFNLLGGEPLLHPQITECVQIVGETLKSVRCIRLITNGLLLEKMDGSFFETCKKYNIIIPIAAYPIHLDMDSIYRCAEQYGAAFLIRRDGCILRAYSMGQEYFEWSRHTLDLSGQQPKWQIAACPLHKCGVQYYKGKLYSCPIRAYAQYFNEYFHQDLELQDNDGIDIFTENSWSEIARRLSEPSNFCKYCDVKEIVESVGWETSKRSISEYLP